MRIMIVDDEIIIRTGLAHVIKWSELGLTLLEPADSAEEALGRLEKERPNIILTDIRMAGKSGLELAEEAKRLYPDMEIIILSGYDDFVYTQQAIRQGVSDYLLKTSRPEEIIKTVLKAVQRIEEKRADVSRSMFQNKEARNRLFESWIVEGENTGANAEQIGILLPRLFERSGQPDRKLLILLISAEGWNEPVASERLLLFAVENMIHDLIRCETVSQKKRIVVAIETAGEPGIRYYRPVLEKIEQLLKCRLFAAAGISVDDPAKLHESYQTADYTFGYKGLLDLQFCDYSQVEHRKGGKPVCGYKDELKLFAILLADEPLSLKEWVDGFVGGQLRDQQMTRQSLESFISSVVLAAFRWLERVRGVSGEGGDTPKQPEEIKLGLSMDHPAEELFRQLYAIMKHYHNSMSAGQPSHVKRTIAYIETHLEGDVGLQQTARYVHVHPGHLSEIFKKETGMTFGDYVTRQKMRRAMDLLAESPAKVSEIALRVGYEDVKYFTQLFKKQTGQTPREFRENSGSGF
ncbi:MAG: two-component system response regulator [Paenibacillaceae bacterium]|jgi:two-component system response regulator YesN|nr:two-component system response regulator [Paenibacillaceae bacterium]